MPTDLLTNTFSALADPTRRAILARLVLGEATVNELAEPFDMSVQAISKHLKVLERGGLIVRGREAQARPSRLNPEALRRVDEWLAEYRRHLDERLDRFGDYVKKLQGEEKRDGRRKQGRRNRADT